MDIQSRVQSKVLFDINYIVNRLTVELNPQNINLYDIIFDVENMILNYINQNKIPVELETTLYEMTKEYYFLNGFDKLNNSSENSSDNNDSQSVKSIERLNEKIEFHEESNITKINGRTYATGTIEFDEDILLEKYSKRLNRFRKMRW